MTCLVMASANLYMPLEAIVTPHFNPIWVHTKLMSTELKTRLHHSWHHNLHHRLYHASFPTSTWRHPISSIIWTSPSIIRMSRQEQMLYQSINLSSNESLTWLTLILFFWSLIEPTESKHEEWIKNLHFISFHLIFASTLITHETMKTCRII